MGDRVVSRILITGSNGLLGDKLIAQLQDSNIPFLATSMGKNRNCRLKSNNYCVLDIRDGIQMKEVFDKFNPTHVIHTAALTNVDYCELNPVECFDVNVKATERLFALCKARNIHFQLLSTDFVFDGMLGNYSEEDQRNPLSVYAESKCLAEDLLLKSEYRNWSVVRTIILYGNAPHLSRGNLIVWAKSALQEKKQIKVIDDQYRAPTWADDLAWACIRICVLGKKGIYHISGSETNSIYELVERVAKHLGLSMDFVQKVDSQTLNQPAKRPPRTGFNLTKAKMELGYTPKTLEETLAFI